MNVRELIEKLSRLDPDLVVVMEQNDEPLGQYEVLDVDVRPAKPDDIYHRSAPRGTWDYPQVWSTWDGGDEQVVLLGSSPSWKPVIDAGVVLREIEPS